MEFTTEVEFYPPGLKEAYEEYISRTGILNRPRKKEYFYLTIYGDVFTFTVESNLVSEEPYDPILNPVGYTTFNGVDVRVYLSIDSPDKYQHLILTNRNPKTFTVEYMLYANHDPKKDGILDYGPSTSLFGALDLENIPKIGEDISEYEPIKYVFYEQPKLLFEARKERRQSRAASEVKDSVSTDSIPRVEE